MVLTSVNRNSNHVLDRARSRQYDRTHGAPKKLATNMTEFPINMESFYVPQKSSTETIKLYQGMSTKALKTFVTSPSLSYHDRQVISNELEVRKSLTK